MEYRVGMVTALALERSAVTTLLDEHHEHVHTPGDDNVYTFGRIASHNVVITCLPAGVMGKASASTTANNMKRSFPIDTLLMVGIGGGVPGKVKLGDVVVSVPGRCGAVVQYDYGKTLSGGTQIFSTLNKPPRHLLNAVQALRAQEDLRQRLAEHFASFSSRFARPSQDLDGRLNAEHLSTTSEAADVREPEVLYGTIASGDQVIKDAAARDRIAEQTDAICFEMEAAALMDDFPCLVIRGICDYADMYKSKEWQRYAAAQASCYAKELLRSLDARSVNPSNSRLPFLSSELQHSELCRQVVNSLAFNSMDARLMIIDNPFAGTCQWLLEDSRYKRWLTMVDDQFLWIKGKPGAGKSTIMKFAAAQTPSGDSVRLQFFFNARGHDLDKSAVGMYRSLAHQLLVKGNAEQLLTDIDSSMLSRMKESWQLPQLKFLVRHVISRFERRIQCFIDALDECSTEEVRDMVHFFEDLTKSRIFICFASRFYPTISIPTAIELILNGSKHDNDLETYVRGRLAAPNDYRGETLKQQVIQKASGVFFWAVLVVKMLNKHLARGSLFQVQRTLASLPKELNELLETIVVSGSDGHNFSLSMQLILFAKRPLSVKEYYCAMLTILDENDETAQGSYLLPWGQHALTAEQLNRFVISSTKGLAEVVRQDDDNIFDNSVQLIHESVRDYLVHKGGLQKLNPDLTSCRIHRRLAQLCARYSSVSDHYHWTFNTIYPFVDYVVDNLFFHASHAAMDKHQLDCLLRTTNMALMKDAAMDYFRLASHHTLQLGSLRVDDFFPENLLLVHIIAHYDAHDLLPHLIDLGHRLDHVQSLPPLTLAVMGNSYATVEALLHYGVDVHETYLGFTALHHCLWSLRSAGICDSLLVHGANPNLSDSFDRLPLWLALEARISVDLHDEAEEACQSFGALLLAGADANSRRRFDGATPLMFIAKNQIIDCAQVLLQHEPALDIRDARERTALMYASENGCTDLVVLLLRYGASTRVADVFGRTALMYACCCPDPGPASYLLQANARADVQDATGWTPLMIACRYGQADNVELLLKHGVRTDIADFQGRTAFELASQYRCTDCIELLVEHNADIGHSSSSQSSNTMPQALYTIEVEEVPQLY